jgi:hypothetical protein
MIFEVSVGGILVLDALMPESQGLVRALLLLVVGVQVIAFTLWIVMSSPSARDQREAFEGGAEAQARALWLGSEERR